MVLTLLYRAFHLLNKFWRQAGFNRPPVVVGEDDVQLKEVLGVCLRCGLGSQAATPDMRARKGVCFIKGSRLLHCGWLRDCG